MKIVLCDDPEDAAKRVAEVFIQRLKDKPDLVLGLATGSTPIGVYRILRKACADGDADFSRVHTFNLDEYLDLPPDHLHSYHHFMRYHLFDGINIPPENIHFPPSEGNDLLRRCKEYERLIKDIGGIDLQLLGIGRNGHVGFNEPTSALNSRTRIKILTERTLTDNARFYGEDETQPTMASTMGIGTILDAREILLQAMNRKKAEAVWATVEGPVSSFFPASALQLHQKVTAYLDPEAASLLRMRAYYRRAEDQMKTLDLQGRL